MENPLKALLGQSADEYMSVKVDWLLSRFAWLSNRPTRILDYGCGAGTFLRLLAEAAPNASLSGCDVSADMLAEAGRRWPENLNARKPELQLQQTSRTSFSDAAFDLVVISAVLHHVPLGERPIVYQELCRVTQPDGIIAVFEHNPGNPVTRYVVSRTPIDRHAILLRAREVMDGLAAAHAGNICTRYLMFAPPRMRSLRALDKLLFWLPVGAQYVVTAVPNAVLR
jgi:ubiquinone/menaquinone biosynthesis C-methylase UbiE